jgi:two-component system, sensor histidine kinase PdtaS
MRALFAALLIFTCAVEVWISMAPPGQLYRAGQMVALLIPALLAAWIWVEGYLLRPLTTLTAAAIACVDGQEVELARNTPQLASEFKSLRRSIAAMAKAMRNQEQRIDDVVAVERALLLEVNHRIRNNLQMVASVLALDARAGDNDQAQNHARAPDRIRLLSLAHDRIYASGEVHAVRLDDLAAEIGRTFMLSRGQSVRHIRLDMSLTPTLAPNDCAVPMAFLVGECLTYALELLGTAASASLTMALGTENDGAVEFSLSSSEFPDLRTPPPFVLRILTAFAGQLKAEVDFPSDGPVLIKIRIPNAGLQTAA